MSIIVLCLVRNNKETSVNCFSIRWPKIFFFLSFYKLVTLVWNGLYFLMQEGRLVPCARPTWTCTHLTSSSFYLSPPHPHPSFRKTFIAENCLFPSLIESTVFLTVNAPAILSSELFTALQFLFKWPYSQSNRHFDI